MKGSYRSEQTAAEEISRALNDFYRSKYPDLFNGRQAEVEKAIRGVQEVWRRNVFPDMNVGFGTYRNNIGHVDFPGCFRCHDDNHTSKDRKTIGQDCDLCHRIQ